MKKYILGIDVGGTNIKLGLVDEKGRISGESHLATKRYISNQKTLIDGIYSESLKIFQKLHISKKNIRGIGIGLPGLIDVRRGVVRFLPNVSGWRNVPLRSILSRKFRLPIFIENDVNLVTLAEWKYGAGKHCDNLICITLGTGVGGGLILNGRLYRGKGFSAGEIGHIPLAEKGPKCNCGGYACLERHVGNSYLLQNARTYFRRKNITLEEVNHLAARGRPRARQFWKKAAGHIGYGFIGIVNVLNPERIIIGGGISAAYPHISKTIQQILKKRCMPVQGKMVKVVKARLGACAGILGAQVYVQYKKQHNPVQ